jgi:hypothetical protein
VRLRFPDGQEQPLTVRYDGQRGGVHVWMAETVVDNGYGWPTAGLPPPPWQLLMDELPPHTEVRFTSEWAE